MLHRMLVKYYGKASHAAAYPWEGVNALDAAVLAYNNISVLRQQLKPDWRIHGEENLSQGHLKLQTLVSTLVKTSISSLIHPRRRHKSRKEKTPPPFSAVRCLLILYFLIVY